MSLSLHTAKGSNDFSATVQEYLNLRAEVYFPNLEFESSEVNQMFISAYMNTGDVRCYTVVV